MLKIKVAEDYEDKINRTTLNSRHWNNNNNNYSRDNNSRDNQQYKKRNTERNVVATTQPSNEESVNSVGRPNPFRDNSSSQNNSNRDQIRTYICYNCDKPGHTFRYCKEPYRPSCRHCRKKGITTNACGCTNEPRPVDICPRCRKVGYTADNCPCSTPSASQQNYFIITHQLGAMNLFEDPRPTREIEVIGKKYYAILYTGANIHKVIHKQRFSNQTSRTWSGISHCKS